jgi:ABC-type sugar transport system ATPase subunit
MARGLDRLQEPAAELVAQDLSPHGPAFAVRDVTMRFGRVEALRGLSLTGHAAEILGVAGENGAGKSTLMKILAGLHAAGSYLGEVEIGGRPLAARSVRDAERAGVVLVPQELASVPDMTVAENVFLNREPRRLGLIQRGAMERRTRALLDQLGLDVSPRAPMTRLGIAARQTVELAKALNKDARILLLDEPTSSLTAPEIAPLFERLRELRRDGLCLVYISHRLDELLDVTDRIAVMRDGQLVEDLPTSELDEQALVHAMIGRRLAAALSGGGTAKARRPALTVEGWHVSRQAEGRTAVEDVSFSVGRGEILGVFGNVGAGRTELLSSLVGMTSYHGNGRALLGDRPYRPRSPVAALRAGVAFVTEDRKEFGIEPSMSVLHNVTLARVPSRLAVIDTRRERAQGEEMLRAMRVVCGSVDDPITSLSGGNQQKVLLGRALMGEPQVLLLDEPGRGVDVGAKAEIFTILRGLADQGLSLVIAFSEAQEALGLADRVLVLYRGRAVGTYDAAGLDESDLAALAAGISEPMAA